MQTAIRITSRFIHFFFIDGDVSMFCPFKKQLQHAIIITQTFELFNTFSDYACNYIPHFGKMSGLAFLK